MAKAKAVATADQIKGECVALLRSGETPANVAAAMGVPLGKVRAWKAHMTMGCYDRDPAEVQLAEAKRVEVLEAMGAIVERGFTFENAAFHVGRNPESLALDIVGLLAMADFGAESAAYRKVVLDRAFRAAGFDDAPPAPGDGGRGDG